CLVASPLFVSKSVDHEQLEPPREMAVSQSSHAFFLACRLTYVSGYVLGISGHSREDAGMRGLFDACEGRGSG
ncbi:MAG TPA: hypothetical protein VN718_07245, partial [Rhizomicrobium sp.]|nr:hypothetical protein [Rhizomicrobium sp.]